MTCALSYLLIFPVYFFPYNTFNNCLYSWFRHGTYQTSQLPSLIIPVPFFVCIFISHHWYPQLQDSLSSYCFLFLLSLAVNLLDILPLPCPHPRATTISFQNSNVWTGYRPPKSICSVLRTVCAWIMLYILGELDVAILVVVVVNLEFIYLETPILENTDLTISLVIYHDWWSCHSREYLPEAMKVLMKESIDDT